MNNQLSRRNFKSFWLMQIAFILIISLVCIPFSLKAALSALLGGFVCIIPNLCFAAKLFKQQGARAARQIVKNFYQGEALKIMLSVALFTVAFTLFKVTALAFFVSYILILMTHWFSPLIIDLKKKGK